MRVEDLDESHHHVPPTNNRTTPWDPTKRAAATTEHARKYAATNALKPTTDATRSCACPEIELGAAQKA